MKEAPHPVDLYAGQRLRELRQSRGLSQADLGQRLSRPITFQQIQKYERGVNRMALSRIYEFAEALQVPVNQFIPEADFADDYIPTMTKQEYEVINRLRNAPSKLRNSIIALLKTIGKDDGMPLSE